ncbi:hypothetical protein ABEB36_014685 [Hypothenemus hampei]|uniref:PilZ domain-containing protein n=2 Tax=Hypothenemus hampei TaxID=57062 RepID=A0ABD1E2T9_HYPHA
MNYHYHGVKTITALEELRLIQKKRCKMSSKIDIGEATIIFLFANGPKIYKGNVIIDSSEDSISIYSKGKLEIGFPCHEIICCNVIANEVIIQFSEHYFAEKCNIKFYGVEQVKKFTTKLPLIRRPEIIETNSDSSSASE